MFDFVETGRQQRQAELANTLAGMYAELAAPKFEEQYSLMRAVNKLARGELQAGSCYEANVNQAAQLGQGAAGYTPGRLIVPWGALGKRNLVVSTPTAGGNLVGTAVTDAMDVLRPYSIVSRLGVSTLDNQVSNLSMPNVTGEIEGEWLADEGSALTPSDVTLGAVSSSPKTGGAILKASFNFMRQGKNAEAFLRQQLLETVGTMIDRAVLQGTGADGQPKGLLYADDVWEDEGASFEMLNAAGMEGVVTTANADDEKLRWMVHPSMRLYLRLKEWGDWPRSEAWRKGGMIDIPGHASTSCPSNWIFLGDWSRCTVVFWGSGIEIEIDPYTNFTTGVIAMRVLVHADVAFTKPGAFGRFHIPSGT